MKQKPTTHSTDSTSSPQASSVQASIQGKETERMITNTSHGHPNSHSHDCVCDECLQAKQGKGWEERLERIRRDLRNEVGWLENGKPRGLDEAQISIILTIIDVNLENFLSQQRKQIIEEVWKLIDEYPRIEITHKDKTKTRAVLEHSLKQARELSQLEGEI